MKLFVNLSLSFSALRLKLASFIGGKILEEPPIPIRFRTDLDEDADEKVAKIIGSKNEFGEFDFADLASWLFASSLSNHRVAHQRLDEGACLWRAVKASSGPILEVGRAAGGSTVLLLGASGDRQVVSIDQAPTHNWAADVIFNRADVKRRLNLYIQSSREEINETDFGLIFIDGDHSYEGICHDIGAFWNKLRSDNGDPSLAVFHDGAKNPVTFVRPVYQACLELLENPNVARKVESWGSMLVIEKVGDIDEQEWFRKEHTGFWEQYSSPAAPIYTPEKLNNYINFTEDKSFDLSANVITDGHIENGHWKITNMSIQPLPLTADNPVRLLKEEEKLSMHGFSREFAALSKKLEFTFFVRPLGTKAVSLKLGTKKYDSMVRVKIDLVKNKFFDYSYNELECTLVELSSMFRCGYFRITCRVDFFGLKKPDFFGIGINALDDCGADVYEGDSNRGLFINLTSLRFSK